RLLSELMWNPTRGSLFRFQFPEDVDDFPVAVEFGDLEIIDPLGCYDFDDSSVVVAIENCHFFHLSILRRVLAAATSGALHERHRAHVIELAAARFRISRDHTL